MKTLSGRLTSSTALLLLIVGCGGGSGTSDVVATAATVSAAAAVAAPLRAMSASTNDSSPSTSPIRSCATLELVNFSDGSKVTTAVDVPEANGIPRHCAVTLWVPDRINILVRLPIENWNGRYQAVGNGGFAGVILPELLDVPVTQGYVVSATDTGHQGTPLTGEWAWSPTGMNYAQIQDFAFRANHEMADKTKALVAEFYGRPATFSYWNGCSSGGREGLTAAMRYPADFDGIVAGAPAINWTRFIPAEMWPQLVMKEMGNYLPACKSEAITAIVREECDLSDGLLDGLMDSRRCKFQAAQLVGRQTPCGVITSLDAQVIAKIWEGPRRRSNGDFLWYGLERGAPLTLPSSPTVPAVPANGNILQMLPEVALAQTVSVPSASPLLPASTALDGLPFAVTNDWFKYFLNKNPLWDWHSLTYESFETSFDQSVTEWESLLATNNADLSDFRARGGKVLIWHGMADQVIFPSGSIDYYGRLSTTMGKTSTQDFARLFLAPNVGHCMGGNGPAPQDPLAAVTRWRESGQAPDTLLASLPPATGVNTTSETMTRPICAYPRVAAYTGVGSAFKAENFRCVVPR